MHFFYGHPFMCFGDTVFTYFSPEEVQKEATEVSFEEMFFGELKQEDPQEEEEEEGFIGRGIHLVHELECEKVASSPMALCSVEQVKQLALTSITTCIADSDKCGKPVTLEHSFVGSALYVKWVRLDHKIYNSQ